MVQDASTVVIDHTSYAVSETDEDHTLIASDNFIESDVILGSTKIEASFAYLLIVAVHVLSASSAAYSASPKCPEGWKFEEISMNNPSYNNSQEAKPRSEGVVEGEPAGAPEKLPTSGCQLSILNTTKSPPVPAVSKTSTHHSVVGENDVPSPAQLLKEYAGDIYEWSGTRWEPYVANDFQVQFYLMSPYVLKTLSTNKKVEYQRLGYTSLSLSKQRRRFSVDDVFAML
ncbi:hypothetical protein RJ639_023301 [Escallonia herrerae]|uniref:Uncharacterized protein n=1 Tax=Escallonia herrerae TaxID=1293975 RepID=A0AA88UZF3_9ASTE|nr:hypothetical protein RJ639_023301 [Escallonia herrerae]